MLGYQKTSTIQRNQSLVPPKASDLYLTDNRDQSVLQRKLQNVSVSDGVYQLGVNKKKIAKKKAAKKKKPKKAKPKVKDVFDRPSFTADSKKSAIYSHNSSGRYSFSIDPEKPDLPSLNAAQPHRFPWKDIREVVRKRHLGTDKGEYLKFVKFLNRSGDARIRRIQRRLKRSRMRNDTVKIKVREELLKRAQGSQKSFQSAHDSYEKKQDDSTLKELLRQANSHHANVPDYGPHQGVNNPVSDAIHLNLRRSRSRKRSKSTDPHPRSPSPTSGRLLKRLVPGMSEKGIAMITDGRIITTGGEAIDVSLLRPKVQKRVKRFKKTIIKGYLDDAPFGSPYVKKG